MLLGNLLCIGFGQSCRLRFVILGLLGLLHRKSLVFQAVFVRGCCARFAQQVGARICNLRRGVNSLTIHSSGRRFAPPLNSGVRLFKIRSANAELHRNR